MAACSIPSGLGHLETGKGSKLKPLNYSPQRRPAEMPGEVRLGDGVRENSTKFVSIQLTHRQQGSNTER